MSEKMTPAYLRADDLLVRGVSRAIAMVFAALVEDDAQERRRASVRLERALKVCRETVERAPELTVTQLILNDVKQLIDQATPAGDARRR